MCICVLALCTGSPTAATSSSVARLPEVAGATIVEAGLDWDEVVWGADAVQIRGRRLQVYSLAFVAASSP